MQTLFSIRSKKYFFLKEKKEKRDQKVSKQRTCTNFFRIRLPQKMRSWKILRGGKGSNFLSFLAPGGGDGTWFRILEKKSSTRLAASLCVKFWNDVQFFHSQRMCGKSSGSTCWLWKIMLITFEYNIKQKPIEITQCFLSFHFHIGINIGIFQAFVPVFMYFFKRLF